MHKKLFIAATVVAGLFLAGVAMAAGGAPVFSTVLSTPSTTITVATSTTVTVMHDAPQQNTCYVVVAKNGSGNAYTQVSTSISCVADHVASDYPATPTVPATTKI